MLLLRATVGLISVVHGVLYAANLETLSLSGCVVSSLSVLGGACLLLGFLTPVASAMVAISAATIGLSSLNPSRSVFEVVLPTALIVVIATAVLFIGPGAVSIDARLFGRREIIIPPKSRSPKL